ncbi:MAG: tetratricopeptide repeat protein [Lentisphaerae bacterium]|nr:tetratricopeptide repeat protein [Lentisphaerota bacterium]
MNKSLAPLIISFAVIILLTFIIINTKPRESAIELQTNGTAPTMSLSPVSKTQFKHKAPLTRKQRDSYIPDSEKFLENAKIFLSDGKENEAEDTLRTLLIFEPDNPQALSLLAGIFYYSQRYSEAEIIFRRQVKLNPDNDAVYNRLGSALARQGKMKEAIRMTMKAADINPKSSDAQINLSSMCASNGDLESSIKHFLLAYQLIGYRILPFSYDPAFDKVRSSPEFQEIISMAKKEMDTNLRSNKIPDKSVISNQ